MVERWCQEIHIFHLCVGKAIITLQNIAILLELQVHVLAITGTVQIIWSDLYEELFGIRLSETMLSGSTLRFH